MKKLFSFVALVTVATTMFTSCSNNNEDTPKTPKISVSVEKPSIAIGTNGTFTVSSTATATSEITVNVASSKTDVLTITDAVVKIAQGKKTVTGSFSALKEGDADITITTSTSGVALGTAKVNVKVGTKIEGDFIIKGGYSSDQDGANPLTEISSTSINGETTFADICFESPDGVKALGGDPCDNWVSGGLWYHTHKWTEVSESGPANISIDNYGCDIVGTQADANSPMYYTILEENVAINEELTWISNKDRGDDVKGYNAEAAKYYMAPYVYSSQSPEINKGKEGYVVGKFSYSNSAKGISLGFFRGWVKVSISADGDVTIKGMAICIGDGEFKTGQTK